MSPNKIIGNKNKINKKMIAEFNVTYFSCMIKFLIFRCMLQTKNNVHCLYNMWSKLNNQQLRSTCLCFNPGVVIYIYLSIIFGFCGSFLSYMKVLGVILSTCFSECQCDIFIYTRLGYSAFCVRSLLAFQRRPIESDFWTLKIFQI